MNRKMSILIIGIDPLYVGDGHSDLAISFWGGDHAMWPERIPPGVKKVLMDLNASLEASDKMRMLRGDVPVEYVAADELRRKLTAIVTAEAVSIQRSNGIMIVGIPSRKVLPRQIERALEEHRYLGYCEDFPTALSLPARFNRILVLRHRIATINPMQVKTLETFGIRVRFVANAVHALEILGGALSY